MIYKTINDRIINWHWQPWELASAISICQHKCRCNRQLHQQIIANAFYQIYLRLVRDITKISLLFASMFFFLTFHKYCRRTADAILKCVSNLLPRYFNLSSQGCTDMRTHWEDGRLQHWRLEGSVVKTQRCEKMCYVEEQNRTIKYTTKQEIRNLNSNIGDCNASLVNVYFEK